MGVIGVGVGTTVPGGTWRSGGRGEAGGRAQPVESNQAKRGGNPPPATGERGRILVLVHRLAVVVVLSVGFVGQRLDDADVELQRREHH